MFHFWRPIDWLIENEWRENLFYRLLSKYATGIKLRRIPLAGIYLSETPGLNQLCS